MQNIECEAMLIDFNLEEGTRYAVKISFDGVNAITGAFQDHAFSQPSQDYMVLPEQPRLRFKAGAYGEEIQIVAGPPVAYDGHDNIADENPVKIIKIEVTPAKAHVEKFMRPDLRGVDGPDEITVKILTGMSCVLRVSLQDNTWNDMAYMIQTRGGISAGTTKYIFAGRFYNGGNVLAFLHRQSQLTLQ